MKRFLLLQVRHITRCVAEKARRIVEKHDERHDTQKIIETQEIPLVERVSEGRYCIGGRIYFVRVSTEFRYVPEENKLRSCFLKFPLRSPKGSWRWKGFGSMDWTH